MLSSVLYVTYVNFNVIFYTMYACVLYDAFNKIRWDTSGFHRMY